MAFFARMLMLLIVAVAVHGSSLPVLGAKMFPVGDAKYYALDDRAGQLRLDDQTPIIDPTVGFGLATVVTTNSTDISPEALVSVIEQYGTDDVWSADFLTTVILVAPPSSSLRSDSLTWLADQGAKFLLPGRGVNVSQGSCSGPLPLPPQDLDLVAGPYFLKPGEDGSVNMHRVYRLYHNNTMSFTQGIVAVPGTNSFEGIDAYDPRTTEILIPVPSRLYSLADTRPLAGLRFAVKDLFDVRGTQTTGGSRVYAEMMPLAEDSAISIEKLLQLGAVPVGKTKTSQFAYGIEPWFWQDYKYPWNPRGDGWMQIAYSSSGSGAAIVAYEWLDFALGSDTGGSVRMPASLGGSYGVRPTWGGMDLAGVLPLANAFDSAGFFARDPGLFAKIGKLWYANSDVVVDKPYESFPTKLLYPVDYFPFPNAESQQVVDEFLAKLETEMGMMKEEINITKILERSHNPFINNKTVTEGVFGPTFAHDSWRGIGRGLVDKWTEARPDTGFPAFENGTRASYMDRESATDEVYQGLLADKEAWKDYAEEQILRPSNQTCSDGIMLMHSGGNGLPVYREEYLNEQPGAGFLVIHDPPMLNPCMISPLMNTPQIDIPIGQAPYQSVISLQTEKLPIVVDLMASQGCDYMLYDLVAKLQEKGVVQTVKTGKVAF